MKLKIWYYFIFFVILMIDVVLWYVSVGYILEFISFILCFCGKGWDWDFNVEKVMLLVFL